MVAEILMIGVDNSWYMRHYDPYRYDLQLDCIRSYCDIKLQSNPKIAIGILTMGTMGSLGTISRYYLAPTSDLDELLCDLDNKYSRNGGDLDLAGAINCCVMSFPLTGPDRPPRMPRRMLLFIGGSRINMTIRKAESLGKKLKRCHIAVDIVNFDLQEEWSEHSNRMLNTFVAAANNNDNCHISHFPAKPCTRYRNVLSSNPDIFPLASRNENEIPKIKTYDSKAEEMERAYSNAKFREWQMKLGKNKPLGKGDCCLVHAHF